MSALVAAASPNIYEFEFPNAPLTYAPTPGPAPTPSPTPVPTVPPTLTPSSSATPTPPSASAAPALSPYATPAPSRLTASIFLILAADVAAFNAASLEAVRQAVGIALAIPAAYVLASLSAGSVMVKVQLVDLANAPTLSQQLLLMWQTGSLSSVAGYTIQFAFAAPPTAPPTLSPAQYQYLSTSWGR